MIIKCLPIGMFGSNCYILGEDGEGIVIDAGVESMYVLKAIEESNLKIKYIVLTHGHIDHICHVDDLREKTGAKVMINKLDAACLTDFYLNGSALFADAEVFKAADGYVEDGDILEAGNLKFQIIHTPGHNPGCICIKTYDSVFTGDTLFKRAVGRTDLPGGDFKSLADSIKNKLFRLPDETKVYPGHGDSTTIGLEKRSLGF